MLKKVFVFMLVLCTMAFSQYSRPGSTSGQFLKIGVSPRGTAMADAFISITDGAEATHYNPAALVLTQGIDMVFNHTEWFIGINHEFAAVSKNLGDLGAFAVSMTAMYTDLMKVRTPLQPEGTGETFYAGSYRYGLSYARYLTDHVSIGVNLNYIQMELYKNFTDDAIAGDIAVLYSNNPRNFRFAMKIANFGNEIKFVNESYPIPVNFTFGISVNAIEAQKYKVLTSLTSVVPNDGPPLARGGVEWTYMNSLSMRGGYHFNHDVVSLTLGGGVRVPISHYFFTADYSYNAYNKLGGVHSFGIRLHF